MNLYGLSNRNNSNDVCDKSKARDKNNINCLGSRKALCRRNINIQLLVNLKRYCTPEKVCNFSFLTETVSKNMTLKKTASQNHV